MRTRLRMIGARRLDAEERRTHATLLLRQARPAPWHVVQTVMDDVLARAIGTVRAGGWPPGDLVELLTRRGHPRQVALLDADTRPTIRDLDDLGVALQVASLLHHVPLLDGAEALQSETGPPHPKLAKVRALLAKAESTPYPEEAEALSAKAQELISRYALDRLLDESQDGRSASGVVVRRIWLDPPYTRAKASLVHQVALANHARAATCDRFAYSVVVGAPGDLEAVELMVTSLLVQADRAMLQHRSSEGGGGRMRSFRRAFLLAFATRIGERLRRATDAVAEGDERLLPVLRDHSRRVSEAFDALVPHTSARRSGISNYAGWAAGLAAADLAQLDVNPKLTSQTG